LKVRLNHNQMESVLEVQRRGHEEIERLEQAITDELADRAKTVGREPFPRTRESYSRVRLFISIGTRFCRIIA
jgi:hypothetical protein